jgi:hypothetical protein
MGSKREITGADTRRAGDDEQQPDLAAAGRICLREPASGRVCLSAATSPAGAAERQVGIVTPANCNYSAGNGGTTAR